MKVERSASTNSAYIGQGYYRRNQRPTNDVSGPTKSSSGMLDATHTTSGWHLTTNNVTPLSLIPTSASGYKNSGSAPTAIPESFKREWTAHTNQTTNSTECESPARKNSQLPITTTVAMNSYRKRFPERSPQPVEVNSPYTQLSQFISEQHFPIMSATTGSFFAEINSNGLKQQSNQKTGDLQFKKLTSSGSKADLKIVTSSSNMFRISQTQTQATDTQKDTSKSKAGITPFLRFRTTTSDRSDHQPQTLPMVAAVKSTKEESKASRQTVNQLYTKTLLHDLEPTLQSAVISEDSQEYKASTSPGYNPLK